MARRSKWAEVERLLWQRAANWPWLPPSLRPPETPEPEPWWLVALYLSPALGILGLAVWGVVQGLG